MEEFPVRFFAGNGFRCVSDQCAIELEPICDSFARPINSLPNCDRLEVVPMRWGLPDSLITEHPDAVEEMRLAHHQGAHSFADGNLLWDVWLQHFGKAELSRRFGAPEIEQVWLNPQTGLGFRLLLLARPSGGQNHVCKEDLQEIRYRAIFRREPDSSTVYLRRCAKGPLHLDEARLLTPPVGSQLASAAPNRLSRGWTNDDFSVVRIANENGPINEIGIPRALRYVLQALFDQPSHVLVGPALTRRVEEIRRNNNSVISQEAYRLQHTMKSVAARRLREAGVIDCQQTGKQWVYTLRPPAI